MYFSSITSSLLKGYEDIFMEQIPGGLPLLREVKHKRPDFQISNKVANRINHEENKELQRKEEEKLNKGLVR